MGYENANSHRGADHSSASIDSSIGFRLLQRRRDLGNLTEELARLLKMTVNLLADLESGRRSMSASVLHSVATLLTYPWAGFTTARLHGSSRCSVDQALQREYEALMNHDIATMTPERRVRLLDIARLLADRKN